MSRVELVVPDLGNFSEVPIVDVLVKPGDVVAVDSPLVTLETDKAAMDVPSTASGTIAEVIVRRGDKVSRGTVLARLDTAAQTTKTTETARTSAEPSQPSESSRSSGSAPEAPADRSTQLLVLGAGPGGYTAAFRAADLGMK
ncbi:MAG: biotin/lipoyl-containing protein, partial [Steroidobacteraceae bacterium]